jgi:hypothetical protein
MPDESVELLSLAKAVAEPNEVSNRLTTGRR